MQRKRKTTVKELTLTLVFTGTTRSSLDNVLAVAMKYLHTTTSIAPWASKVRAARWIVRILTLHPRGAR